jgi:hypothetical protein
VFGRSSVREVSRVGVRGGHHMRGDHGLPGGVRMLATRAAGPTSGGGRAALLPP